MAERAWARAGDTYFQAQRYDDARRSYRGLLEHFSASHAAGLASLRLAQCEYNAGRDAQALEAFATVIERFANTPYEREAKRGTELALYRLSQRPDGHAVLARLVEQFPTSAFAADALLQIAKRRLQEKKWAEAADGFRQVVSRFPGYSAADQAQFLMADASAQAGDSEGARNAYEQFLSWFPNSEFAPTAGLRLGLLHFEAKNFAAAAVAFTRVLSDSAPSDVRAAARFDLALCHRQLGESEEARAEFGRYRAEFPSGSQTAEVIYQLADMDEAAENLPAAVQGFERALELGPRAALAAEIGYRLGRCLERQKDAKGAMRAYTRAAQSGDRTQPFRLSAVARLAALHESRREVTLAVEAYRDIVRNSKDKELVAAAEDRLSQLSAAQRRR
jgi:TolA-binding protein